MRIAEAYRADTRGDEIFSARVEEQLDDWKVEFREIRLIGASLVPVLNDRRPKDKAS